jgi:hypothetical protein
VKKLIGALVVLASSAVVLTVGVAPAVSSGSPVCPAGTSGKIDVSGYYKTLTITAPDGYVITGYCVKAGSTKQGNGPEFYVVDPTATSVVISHSSGKEISHYSYTLEESDKEACPSEDLSGCAPVFGE